MISIDKCENVICDRKSALTTNEENCKNENENLRTCISVLLTMFRMRNESRVHILKYALTKSTYCEENNEIYCEGGQCIVKGRIRYIQICENALRI